MMDGTCAASLTSADEWRSMAAVRVRVRVRVRVDVRESVCVRERDRDLIGDRKQSPYRG